MSINAASAFINMKQVNSWEVINPKHIPKSKQGISKEVMKKQKRLRSQNERKRNQELRQTKEDKDCKLDDPSLQGNDNKILE